MAKSRDEKVIIAATIAIVVMCLLAVALLEDKRTSGVAQERSEQHENVRP